MTKSSKLLKMINEMNVPPSKTTTTTSNVRDAQRHKSSAGLITGTSPDTVTLRANDGKSTLVLGKKVRRMTLLRYVCSKIVYKEDVELRDILALFQCLIDCQTLSQRDPNFKNKFGSTLEVLAKSVKGVRMSKSVLADLSSLRRAILNVPERFLYPKRNLSQIKRRVSGSYHLHFPKSLGIPTKSLPPKLYVGKGYSDKGTAKNVAVDGSPRWQDVAVRRRFGS